MWKFIEDLKKDLTDVKDDILDEHESKEKMEQTEQSALDRGKSAIQGNKIVALEDGTVEMINQDQDEVEIYFDNGEGMGIKFPFGPTAYKVEVSANEKVKKGQTLVTFGPDASQNAQVYAFTPNMIEVLSNSRFRLR